MAKIKKIDKGIELTCECGNIHEVTMNENKDFVCKSIHKKPTKQSEEDDDKTEGKQEPEDFGFNSYFE